MASPDSDCEVRDAAPRASPPPVPVDAAAAMDLEAWPSSVLPSPPSPVVGANGTHPPSPLPAPARPALPGSHSAPTLPSALKVRRALTPPPEGTTPPPLADLFSPNSPKAEGSGSQSPRGSRSPTPSPRPRRSPRVKFEDDVYAFSRDGSEERVPLGEPSSSRRAGKPRSGSSTPTLSVGPTLVPELPLAWDEAGATYEDIDKCVYERKDLGLSREQDEMMVCDCVYDPDDPHGSACGVDSDCINRAIFIECLAKECRAGKHCKNQRLSRRQFGAVDVVLTEKKGFGLRAQEKIPAGSLIYEYIGEVVKETTFRTRMQQYADEGIKHFYFMMLQKEEYIDATKKGGIGRFANHSCNPNCEVQKWVVGRRMRMGIFTKRDVLKDEEITFNYNVDRYGHEAQTCYCGEWNCVGTIGGKTQTDIGGIDDLFLDALGIMDEVKANGMKGSRKKKARQLHEDDYVPTLYPIRDYEAVKVAAALRQSMENPKMMRLLLDRVKQTDDQVVARQLMRMHGFSLMTMILTDVAADREIVKLALESLLNWKVQIRNKIEDSNIEEPVKTLRDGADEELARMADQLLESWSKLELSYKIPRKQKIASLDADDDHDTTTIAEANAAPPRRLYSQMDDLLNTSGIELHIAPVRHVPPPTHFGFRPRPPPPPPPPKPPVQTQPNDRLKLDAIIAMAAQAQVVAPSQGLPATEPSSSSSRRSKDHESRKRQKTSHSNRPLTAEEERRKEKRLTVLIGEVVVNSMSKYKDQMEHDTFKRYAKDCTNVLVDKEKRGHSYASRRHPSLTDEKRAKIKVFTKEFTHKVLRNLKAKGKLKKPGSSSSAANGHSRSPAPTSGSAPETPGNLSLSLATPSMTLSSTPSGSVSHDTPTGMSLIDDIFGTDGRDHQDDFDDSMDLDLDDADSSTPLEHDGTPSASASASICGVTPASPPAFGSPAAPPAPEPAPVPMAVSSVHQQAVKLDHASGPFLKGKAGPILVDRFTGGKD